MDKFQRTMLLSMVVLFCFMFAFLGIPEFPFLKEGDFHEYKLTSLERTDNEGRTTYVLQFGRVSPDSGVSWDYWAGETSTRVELKTSDGIVLYQETRNGIHSSRNFPSHSSNLTLLVTPLCSGPCKFSGLEGGYYTLYSRTPYYEANILLDCIVAVVSLVAVSAYFKKSYSVLHQALLIAPPVVAAFIGWYLYAFDLYGGTFVSVFVGGAIIGGAASLRELVKKEPRSNVEAASLGDFAQIHDFVILIDSQVPKMQAPTAGGRVEVPMSKFDEIARIMPRYAYKISKNSLKTWQQLEKSARRNRDDIAGVYRFFVGKSEQDLFDELEEIGRKLQEKFQ